jgi:hypothetical protein
MTIIFEEQQVTRKNGKYTLTGPMIFLRKAPRTDLPKCGENKGNPYVCPNVSAVRAHIRTKKGIEDLLKIVKKNLVLAKKKLKNKTNVPENTAKVAEFTARKTYIEGHLKNYNIPSKDSELLAWLKKKGVVVKHTKAGDVTFANIQTRAASRFKF